MKTTLLTAAAGLFALATATPAQVLINECYVSHAGADTLEFVELRGPAGTSLNGYMFLVVEGDGASQGTLDRAYDLSGGTIGASGLWVLGTAGLAPTYPAPDMVLPLANDNFENGTDTFYLITTTNVAGVTALVGTDIRNPPGGGLVTVLASDPQITIVDRFGLVDSGYPATDAVFDGAVVLGPDGTFLPAGAVRCCDAPNPFSTTVFLDFAVPPGTPGYAAITPGASNTTCGAPCSSPGTSFCPGDGSGTACPCANHSAVGANEGCLNSLGTAGKLVGSGTPSLSGDTVVLSGSGMPNSSALYFQGTTQQSAGAGAAFGDGLRCAGGSVIRLGTKTNVAGASQYPAGGDPSVSVRGLVTTPGTRTYQVWYRNAAAFCTASTFNVSNGWEITWVM